MCIRWVGDDFSVNEDFLELIQLPKTDAKTVTLALKDSLVRNCLPISQCRGQAYDGASTFRGHINGVAAPIQQVEPAALFVHCLAHCTNLCLQTAARGCTPIRNALDLCMGLSQLIRFSPKRLSLFETLQSQLSVASPGLKPLCPTRWTVRTSAINAVLKTYQILCKSLFLINAETHDEYGVKADGFLSQMENFSTFFGLKLSHLVFAASEQLSLSLQGKDTTVQEAVNASALCRSYLTSLRSTEKFEVFYQSVMKSAEGLTSAPVLPRYRTPPKRPGEDAARAHRFDSPEEFFRQQYFETIDVLVKQLKDRFEQRSGLPMAAKIEEILLIAVNSNCCSLQRLQEDFAVYKKDLNVVQLHVQLHMLPNLVQTRNSLVRDQPAITKVTSVRTIASLFTEVKVGKAMLPDVAALVRIYYTLPVYNSHRRTIFFCPPPPKDIPPFDDDAAATKQCYAAACPQEQMRPP